LEEILKIKVNGRDVEITDDIQSYVDKKFNRLSRHLPQMMDATMEIKRTSSRSGDDRIVVQLTLTVKGQVLRAQRRGSTVSEAVDTAVDVMDRQIRRYKGRRYRSNQGRKSLRDLPDGMVPESDDEMPLADEMEEMTIKVVRRKRFPMIGMTVDDAIAEMELLNHSFYLFRSVETGTYSVVYRREDGDYGLIEPIEG
jgi:putative sigma-54 modulation protein